MLLNNQINTLTNDNTKHIDNFNNQNSQRIRIESDHLELSNKTIDMLRKFEDMNKEVLANTNENTNINDATKCNTNDIMNLKNYLGLVND